MARWTTKGMGITDVTDVPTDVEVVAPDEVRDFVAAHGGRLYVWISVHHGVRCALCLLETVARAPRRSATCTFAGSPLPGSTCTSRPRSASGRRRWSSPCAGAGASRPTGTAWPGSLELGRRGGGAADAADPAVAQTLRRQWTLARQRTVRRTTILVLMVLVAAALCSASRRRPAQRRRPPRRAARARVHGAARRRRARRARRARARERRLVLAHRHRGLQGLVGLARAARRLRPRRPGHACSYGHAVYAIGDGVVFISRADAGGYGVGGAPGGCIIIAHTTAAGTEFQALYGHVYGLKVKEGERVQAGQVIARVNGCRHLHFSTHPGTTYRDGNPYAGHVPKSWADHGGFVDPVKFLKTNPRAGDLRAAGAAVDRGRDREPAAAYGAADGAAYWTEEGGAGSVTWRLRPRVRRAQGARRGRGRPVFDTRRYEASRSGGAGGRLLRRRPPARRHAGGRARDAALG